MDVSADSSVQEHNWASDSCCLPQAHFPTQQQFPLNNCIPEKNTENSRETFALLTTLKPLTVWITTNCRKFFKRWQCQNTLPAS